MTENDKNRLTEIFQKFGRYLKALPRNKLPLGPQDLMGVLEEILTEEEMDFLDSVHNQLTLTERNRFVQSGFAFSGRYIIREKTLPDGITFDLFIAESA